MSSPTTTVAVALAVCIGMWTYVLRVADPNIALQAQVTGNRAGELGDLYPRWYGTRQLLLFGQNPYGERVSEDLQRAYYGDVASAGNRDEQRFAYPAYIVLFLLPTIGLPFPQVQIMATWFMAAAIALSVPLWLEFIGWKLSRWKIVALMALVLSCSPALQALKMQQLSTLVCAFIAAGCYLLRRRAYVFAGVVLALATIKPQMVVLLCLWLFLWTASHLRERRNFLLSFFATAVVLIGIGEWLVPGWVGQFLSAMRAYRDYAGGSAQSVAEMFAGRNWSIVLVVLILIGLAWACFKSRVEAAESARFSYLVSMVLAVSCVVVPPAAPYNHLLLLPGVLILLRDWRTLWTSGKVIAAVSLLATAAIVWPWIAAIGLLLISFFRPAFFAPVGNWALPFYASLIVPLSVTALLVLRWSDTRFGSRR
jgi:hypothetical protein